MFLGLLENLSDDHRCFVHKHIELRRVAPLCLLLSGCLGRTEEWQPQAVERSGAPTRGTATPSESIALSAQGSSNHVAVSSVVPVGRPVVPPSVDDSEPANLEPTSPLTEAQIRDLVDRARAGDGNGDPCAQAYTGFRELDARYREIRGAAPSAPIAENAFLTSCRTLSERTRRCLVPSYAQAHVDECARTTGERGPPSGPQNLDEPIANRESLL